uniref:Uncharacterized protein n=1 Tax=Anguilla anguilla TaxID=7936 RepID=A0A0E9T070_ANGAN
MPEQLKLMPFNVEEQRLIFEVLPES